MFQEPPVIPTEIPARRKPTFPLGLFSTAGAGVVSVAA